MAKLPTYEEMVKKVGKEAAEEALDGYIYKGKTLREWIELLAQTRWIPVTEKLPEKDIYVLATDGTDTFVAWYYISFDIFDEKRIEGWSSYDEQFVRYAPIIAWMPLPQPYKAESEVQE